MAYVGNEAQTALQVLIVNHLQGMGQLVLHPQSAVANEQEIEVFVNYVRQRPGDAYTDRRSNDGDWKRAVHR